MTKKQKHLLVRIIVAAVLFAVLGGLASFGIGNISQSTEIAGALNGLFGIPHLASRLEGNPVRMDVVEKGFWEVCARYDYVTMEGSGGILCPVCFDQEEIWLEYVIRRLGLSCLLVAHAGLGTINSVVLTAEYMRARGIPVKGIVYNRFHKGDIMEEDNVRMCEHRTGLRTLACVKEGAEELDMDPELLVSLYEV